MNNSVFGTEFDRVVVVNLDRRGDRMSSLRDQLKKLGVSYVRQSAVDGKAPHVTAEWQQYLNDTSAVSDPKHAVPDWRDFYLGDKPRASRVAFFERERNTRAIATAGAWGLFQSMVSAIKTALDDRVECLLLLEDDARFHRDTVTLWPKILSELPKDWQIFQLGAMQLHWGDDWIKWQSQHLYRCQGSSIAAHAVALKRDAMRAIVNRCQKPDLPFDIGALQEVKRLYQRQCFTAFPNLVIQDPRDSEIGMSKIFDHEAQKTHNVYRWNWADYDPMDLVSFQAVSSGMNSQRTTAPDVNYLQPYGNAPGSAERVIVVFGPDSDDAAIALIDMLRRQKAANEIAPIVVIDDLAHIPLLRIAGLAFEYVPTHETYESALEADADVRMMIERRLSIIRRKWRPRRIIALGPHSHSRLETWRASPFERATMGADLASDDALRGSAE